MTLQHKDTAASPHFRIALAAHIFGCVSAFLLVGLPARSQAAPAAPPAWLAFEHAWAGVEAYGTTITTFERKGTQVQNCVLAYTFSKAPANATVHFIKGADAGATIVWSGGSTVIAHRGGIIAGIKKKFSVHDPAVETIRGSSVDEMSFGAMLAHSKSTPGTVSQGPGPTILGVRTKAVTLVPRSSVADAGLTREVVEISASTGFPVRALGYAGSTLVRQVDFSGMTLQR